jgi:hypothetical protein
VVKWPAVGGSRFLKHGPLQVGAGPGIGCSYTCGEWFRGKSIKMALTCAIQAEKPKRISVNDKEWGLEFLLFSIVNNSMTSANVKDLPTLFATLPNNISDIGRIGFVNRMQKIPGTTFTTPSSQTGTIFCMVDIYAIGGNISGGSGTDSFNFSVAVAPSGSTSISTYSGLSRTQSITRQGYDQYTYNCSFIASLSPNTTYAMFYRIQSSTDDNVRCIVTGWFMTLEQGRSLVLS